jgi:hypothetical protein
MGARRATSGQSARIVRQAGPPARILHKDVRREAAHSLKRTVFSSWFEDLPTPPPATALELGPLAASFTDHASLVEASAHLGRRSRAFKPDVLDQRRDRIPDDSNPHGDMPP